MFKSTDHSHPHINGALQNYIMAAGDQDGIFIGGLTGFKITCVSSLCCDCQVYLENINWGILFGGYTISWLGGGQHELRKPDL